MTESESDNLQSQFFLIATNTGLCLPLHMKGNTRESFEAAIRRHFDPKEFKHLSICRSNEDVIGIKENFDIPSVTQTEIKHSRGQVRENEIVGGILGKMQHLFSEDDDRLDCHVEFALDDVDLSFSPKTVRGTIVSKVRQLVVQRPNLQWNRLDFITSIK